MDSSEDSDEELFPIMNNQVYFNRDSSVFLYDDPLLMSGILRAVVEEDIEKVKRLIASGKSVNLNDNNGNTPLHISVMKYNLKILEYLLSQDDIIVNVRNFKGETPLLEAVRIGQFQSAKMLIHAGANVNLSNHEDATPLHMAVHYPEIAHLLVLHGAQIDALDYCGDTPLHDASSEACLETVCMLLYYNADASGPGGNNLTPFMKAIISENIEVQQALFEYVDDFNKATDDHTTTLAMALRHASPFVEEIIKRGADVNYSDLYIDENIVCAFFLCLEVPNHNNFKLIWRKIRYNKIKNTINLYLMFEHLERDQVEEYIQVIIESDNLKPAVESLEQNENYFLFINKFAENHLKLEQLTVFTCCLLLNGYRATSYDIYGIFSQYGYCELLRILLYMDNDIKYGWLPYMTVSRLIFDINCQLISKINEVYQMHKRDVCQLLEYFNYPPLVNAFLFKYRDDVYMTSILTSLQKVPSLIELTRNVAREHIIKSFKITNSCQFYTIINHLNISSAYKKILTFEKKLYEVKHSLTDSSTF